MLSGLNVLLLGSILGHVQKFWTVQQNKTKSSDQSSDMIRNANKNKLSTCSLYWEPSDICTKMRMSCLNQTRQREHSFTPFVLLTTDSSAWTVRKQTRICLLCGQDSGSDCKFYFLLMQRNTHIQCD